MTFTRSELLAARDAVDVVASVKHRLAAAGATEALEHLGRLGVAELAVLVRLERRAIAAIPLIPGIAIKDNRRAS